jgi:hypothetical protein
VRILYGSGNFIGSNVQAARFFQNAPEHEIRVAAYYRNHRYLKSFDWCLNALYNTKVGDLNYFESKHGVPGPHVHHETADLIVDDLLEWQPELVISDCEQFTAAVAKILEVPLWYCSSMLQMIGIEHDRKEITTKTFDTLKAYLEGLPKADAYLVYSPLCDISSRPFLKNGFEWVRPYSVVPEEITTEEQGLGFEHFSQIQRAIPSKALLTTGETSFVSDCLYSGKSMYVCPNPSEPEQVLNAQLLEWYGCARNLGRPQSLSFVKAQVEQPNPAPILSIQNWKQLDERLEYER